VTASDERERIALVVHEVRSPTAAPRDDRRSAVKEGRQNEVSLLTLVHLSLAACRSIDHTLGDAALGSIHLQRIDVAELAHDAVAISTLGDARIRPTSAPPSLSFSTKGVRLRHALDNLIENAVAACADQEISGSASARARARSSSWFRIWGPRGSRRRAGPHLRAGRHPRFARCRKEARARNRALDRRSPRRNSRCPFAAVARARPSRSLCLSMVLNQPEPPPARNGAPASR
jgi:hypothetical protein